MNPPLRLKGYWYCDALASPPAYVASALDGSHVLTDRGRLPGTSGGVLYLRIAPDGIRCAGAQQHGDRAVIWNGSTWDIGQPAPAVNPVIFRPDGSLQYPDVAVTGSQGWRFIAADGSPIPGDWTYAPGSPLSRQVGETSLFEWSQVGDVRVGQGGSGGCAIRYRGTLYLLEPGECYFVRANRVGDELAIAIAKLKDREAVIYWLHVSEIPTLQPYETAPPPVPQPPKPEIPKMPWTPRMPNRVDVVAQLKSEHPEEWAAMNAGPDHRFIKRLAWTLHQIDPNFGLNGKRGDVRNLSEDCVAYKNPTVDNGPEVADVVQNHGAPNASPTWINVTKDSQGWKADGTKDADGGAGAAWVQPQPVSGAPAPVPPPVPQPPSGEVAALKRQIAELTAEVLALKARPVATGGSYDETQAMARAAITAYANGSLGREQAAQLGNVDHVMPSATVWHLAFRYLREGYTAAQVVEDARQRGDGIVPQ